MRVKLLIELSGDRDGVPWPGRHQEIDLPDDEAALMCAQGYAEPVAERAEPETATPSPRRRAESRAKD